MMRDQYAGDITHFHRTPVGTPTRAAWVDSMVADLDESDLIFLDPDNGLGRHASHSRQIENLHQQLIDNGFRDPITVSTCVHIAGTKGRTIPRHRFFTLVDGTNEARQRVISFETRLNSLPPAIRASAYCVT